MGYTHYVEAPAGTDFKTGAVAQDVRKLVEASRVGVAHGDIFFTPRPEPAQIGGNGISLNGASRAKACESFDYPPPEDTYQRNRDEIFYYCKTCRNPYDEIVAASLLCIKYHLAEEVEIASDGHRQETEWRRAIRLFARVFTERPLEYVLYGIYEDLEHQKRGQLPGYQMPLLDTNGGGRTSRARKRKSASGALQPAMTGA